MESSSCLHTQTDMQTSGNNNPVDELHAILNRFRVTSSVDDSTQTDDINGSESIETPHQKTEDELRIEAERNKRRCPKCNCLPLRVRITSGDGICRCGNVYKLQEPQPIFKHERPDTRFLNKHCPKCLGTWGYWLSDGRRFCRNCNEPFTPAIDKRKEQLARDARIYNIG
jgi:hypothetical protein